MVFSPLDYSPACWYAADQGVTLASGKVASCTDLSGGNNPAYQTDTNCQPLYVANAYSGKPCFRFDGSNDFLRVDKAVAQPFTAMAVLFESTTGTGFRNVFRSMQGHPDPVLYRSTTLRLFAGADLPGTYPRSGTLDFYTAQFNSTSSVLRVNGRTIVTGNAGASGLRSLVIGAGGGDTESWSAMDMCEFIVFPAALTALQLASVEEYFYWRWKVSPLRTGARLSSKVIGNARLWGGEALRSRIT